MYSLLIKNGRVIDGTGGPERVLDIAIDGGRIVNMAPLITMPARETIDATGKIVSPGFIDVQNHSDVYWQLFENPGLESLTTQGFTTISVGNCGASIAPLTNQNSLLPLQKWRSLEGTNTDWRSVAELKEKINHNGTGANITTLLGYETLRRAFTGDEVRSLTGEERKSILGQILTAMNEGARGVSFGLSYAHEQSSPEHEIKEVMEAVAQQGGLVSIHARNEGSHVVEAIEEVVHLAQQTGARVKISHLKIKNKKNWHQLEQILQILENAWHKKTSVHFDIYPYDTTWQVLYNYLPSWATAEGRIGLLKHLQDPTQRRKILDFIRETGVTPGEFILASTTNQLPGVGKRLSEIAKGLEQSSEETMLYLIEHGGSEVLVFDQNLHPEQILTSIAHPLSIVATDGAGYAIPTDAVAAPVDRLVHPRCFGAAPRFLRMMRESKNLTLPEAIRKLTKVPAELLQLDGRGELAINNIADVVIFDEQHIADVATLKNPYQQSSGIEHVLVSGIAVVENGLITANRPGRFIA